MASRCEKARTQGARRHGPRPDFPLPWASPPPTRKEPEMRRISYTAALCVLAAGCAQPPQQQAKVELTPAANPNLPANVPAWKQGMPDIAAPSPLAPHAGKNTVTPAAEIPINRIKAPAGFRVELWASGMPGARM